MTVLDAVKNQLTKNQLLRDSHNYNMPPYYSRLNGY